MGLTEILVIAGLVFINGFFVAAEFALVKVRVSQIDQLVEQGNWAAWNALNVAIVVYLVFAAKAGWMPGGAGR